MEDAGRFFSRERASERASDESESKVREGRPALVAQQVLLQYLIDGKLFARRREVTERDYCRLPRWQ